MEINQVEISNPKQYLDFNINSLILKFSAMIYKFDKTDENLLKNPNSSSDPNRLQAIPFRIQEKEGFAKVDDYFNCKVTNETGISQSYLKNSLYGRNLKGTDLTLSQKMIGNSIFNRIW